MLVCDVLVTCPELQRCFSPLTQGYGNGDEHRHMICADREKLFGFWQVLVAKHSYDLIYCPEMRLFETVCFGLGCIGRILSCNHDFLRIKLLWK